MKHQLVIQKEGRLDIGPQITHVGHDSPFVNRHHTNWRLKGLQSLEKLKEVDLFYTGPMTLSEEAARSIRKDIVDFIERSTDSASNSVSEEIRCLNIDWFGVDGK